jgi:hypothetical protein
MVAFYLSLIIPILAFLAALYQIPKDMQILKKDFGDKNKWQRLNKKGKWYVTISFFVAVVAEIILIVNGSEINKPIVVSQSKPTIVYVPKIVKDTKLIRERLFVKLVKPILDLSSPLVIGKENPELSIAYKNDTIICTYSVYVSCINQGVIGDISDRHFVVKIKNNNIDLGKFSPKRAVPDNEIIYHENNFSHGIRLWGQFIVGKNYTSDSSYLFIKIDYSDKSTGKQQPSFRRLFNIKRSSTSNDKVFDITKATFYEYKRVKQLLSKTNQW